VPRKIRISNISSLTSLPYRYLSEASFLDYREAPAAENARMLAEGEVDIALVPVTEFASHGGYVGFDFGLAGTSKIDSVFLFGQVPLSALKSICLDMHSCSSVYLLRLILLEKLTRQPHLVRLRHEALLENISGNVGCLVTGDMALTARGKYPFEMDLAEEWHRLTRKPFVFSVWAARPEILTRDLDQKLNKLFNKALLAGESLISDVEESLPLSKVEAVKHISRTVTYRLDNECKSGLSEFFRRAHERNLLPSEPYQTARYGLLGGLTITGGSSRAVDSILDDAINGRRISVAEACKLTEEAALSDLALASDIARKKVSDLRGVEFEIDVGRAEALAPKLIKEKISHLTKKGCGPRLIRLGIEAPQNWEDLICLENIVSDIRKLTNASIEAISIPQILWLAAKTGRHVREIVSRLVSAGVSHLPAVGGEILVDKIRRLEGQGLFTAWEWLNVVKWGHRFGAQAGAGVRVDVADTWSDRFLHLHKLRNLQDETPGFRSLTFLPPQSPERQVSPEVEFRFHMVARLFLDNFGRLNELESGDRAFRTTMNLSCGHDSVVINLGDGSLDRAAEAVAFLNSLRTTGMDIEPVIVRPAPKSFLN
jgi:predicted solute-binding protein/2-iminoacetate synthase ThiH